MLYFNKTKDVLDVSEKHRSISILNFKLRNDANFAQDIIIKQNDIVVDLSSSVIYMTIVPLTSDDILTNYTVTGDVNGKVSLAMTSTQLQNISTSECSSREFIIRKKDGSTITDLAVGKLSIETYALSSTSAEAQNMKYSHTIGEGAEFDFTVNSDNVVVTDIVDNTTGQSIRSGAEITYENSTVTINLYTDRSVDVYYITFNN